MQFLKTDDQGIVQCLKEWAELRQVLGPARKKRRFFGQVYHQRWQAESLISRLKRRLGSTLRSRIWRTQKQECRLRPLTHNVMLLAA